MFEICGAITSEFITRGYQNCNIMERIVIYYNVVIYIVNTN